MRFFARVFTMKDNIQTDYISPPIPTTKYDWRATFTDYDIGDPIGYGATEQEAIADLLEQADND